MMNTTKTLSQYELERGKPMPSKNHSRIERRLNVLLTPFEEKFDILTEVSLDLPTGSSVPDVSLYPKLIYDWERDVIKMTEPPITTIEILSPTQSVNDLIDKVRNVYFSAGVKSAWIIVPPLKSVSALYPNAPTENFTAGVIADRATGVHVLLEELFK